MGKFTAASLYIKNSTIKILPSSLNSQAQCDKMKQAFKGLLL